MTIEKSISPLIKYQFPSFYADQGPDFIAFMEAYYEWMEQQGNVLNLSRSILEYGDVDTTLDEYIKYFKDKYINSLPENIVADKRLLIKHITDLYNSKGSARGYKLLFRLLFNEDIDVFVPNEYLLKPSDANWQVPRYIEVADSPFLSKLTGLRIYTSRGASAVVESFFKKTISGRTLNILYLSDVVGEFKFNDQILSLDIPAINSTNAPLIFGSLSAISIVSGGYNYSVGDLLNVSGKGFGAIARVASTVTETGKVVFTLQNGGFGYSLNALVSVTGGGGTGATFSVGGLANKVVKYVNTDQIDPLKYVTMEYSNTFLNSYQSMNIGITPISGTFSNGDRVVSTANSVHFDVQPIIGTVVKNEILSNTSLGISNLTVYNPDDTIFFVTGPESSLTSANLTTGAVLTGATSGASVVVKKTYPKVTITGNAVVNSAASNGSSIAVYNSTANIGYFVPTATLQDTTSGALATINAVSRTGDWRTSNSYPLFPNANKIVNLDSTLSGVLTNQLLEIGTITYLKNINPGAGYSSNPTVTVTEPYINDLKISDGVGGYWGSDAIVTAVANTSPGVVTGITMLDSGFGYIQNESLLMTSATNPSAVYGISIVDLNGIGLGSFQDNKSFLSDTQVLQDSEYYQQFSYEIVSSKIIDTYRNLVNDLVHPSGVALYGKYAIKSAVANSQSASVSFSLTQI